MTTARIRISTTMTPAQGTVDAIANLGRVATPEALTKILSAAVAASIVADVIERFKQALASRKVDTLPASKPKDGPPRSGDDIIADSRSRLPTLLGILSAKPHLAGPMSVSLFPLAELDQVLTSAKRSPGPTYPEAMTTASPGPNRLWRQLEFGTGIYAKAGLRLVGPSKLPGSAAWFLSTPNQKSKIIVQGERPGSFLVDQNLKHYDESRVPLLRQWFATYFAQALAGQVPGEA
jgi:hypothetical protein